MYELMYMYSTLHVGTGSFTLSSSSDCILVSIDPYSSVSLKCSEFNLSSSVLLYPINGEMHSFIKKENLKSCM